MQKKLACFPDTLIYLIIESTGAVANEDGETLYMEIDPTTERVRTGATTDIIADKPRIEFYMSNQLLLALLTGSTDWNVAEYHMKINRQPDVFEPTLRSLLAFFKL